MTNCIFCKKEIIGESKPVYPGKVPGSKQVVEVKETPYDKTMEVSTSVPVLKDGKPVLGADGYPIMETKTEEVVFTSGVRRKATIHWEGDIPQAHLDCPK